MEYLITKVTVCLIKKINFLNEIKYIFCISYITKTVGTPGFG